MEKIKEEKPKIKWWKLTKWHYLVMEFDDVYEPEEWWGDEATLRDLNQIKNPIHISTELYTTYSLTL